VTAESVGKPKEVSESFRSELGAYLTLYGMSSFALGGEIVNRPWGELHDLLSPVGR
jgi:hypothetical protein